MVLVMIYIIQTAQSAENNGLLTMTGGNPECPSTKFSTDK